MLSRCTPSRATTRGRRNAGYDSWRDEARLQVTSGESDNAHTLPHRLLAPGAAFERLTLYQMNRMSPNTEQAHV
jgi:hypothetical protein